MDILSFPPEVLLHIFSYLDLPELDALASLSPLLYRLACDRALHRTRILVVAPSRLQHALFAYGGALRPTIADLVHWGVMRGLGLERRWRAGLYVYSPQSVRQYESSQRLTRTHVRHVLTIHLQRKNPNAPAYASNSDTLTTITFHATNPRHSLPDSDRVSSRVDRSLVPVMRKLTWRIRCDKVAQMVRGAACVDPRALTSMPGSKMLNWFEGKGRGLWKENERVRLAICPGVRKIVRFYEGLSLGAA